ncbi:hypothetical protein TTHERM_00574300 (macronuclear) [Tetrahymena thermophila SB210]|uniref:Uncharacterized protein n=1 Tax=Tetrahymena thermophila (strain SB210) TaxID=312017 RepID=Q22V71_TETTS|nr:hypothetical protein TTHERM_00574300 [Tetrahymena thermophila SB210]EAR89077.2 hypothetical protein TTHERM_00574300 [Tetrahymena thermophila SB210]|eukprot:XP_001009322.2 hypothetical protein TTHERM_00574300 [Tetrahymena thermophila SB210]
MTLQSFCKQKWAYLFKLFRILVLIQPSLIFGDANKLWNEVESVMTDTILIHCSAQSNTYFTVFSIYCNDFINFICSTFKKNQLLSYSSTQSFNVGLLLNLLNFFIMQIKNVQLIGLFTKPHLFDQFPDLLVLYLSYAILKNMDQQVNKKNVFDIIFVDLLGQLIVTFFFKQQEYLLSIFIFLRIAQYSLVKLTSKSIDIVKEASSKKECLSQIIKSCENLINREVPCFDIDFNIINVEKYNWNKEDIKEEIKKLIQILAYCQFNLDCFKLKMRGLELVVSLPQKKDIIFPFSFDFSKRDLISYLCKSEHLLENSKGIYWLNNIYVNQREFELISQIRLIDFPMSKPVIYRKQVYKQSKEMLMILAYKKYMELEMLFCSQQILYDLYQNLIE